LQISNAQANLMMARGGFDPKIEVDFDKKQFKDKNYYSILNSSFKIPTWYGIEVKAGFESNDGFYVNPENSVPFSGLTSVGISVPLGQGLLINQRMSDLKKAKIQIQLSKAEQKLQAVQIVFDASIAYFNWKRNYSEVQLYENYLNNANTRFKGIQSLIKNGDKPAIDSVEAHIIVRNRALSLEDSRLKMAKAKLELSNFMWLENNIPMELQDSIIPEDNLLVTLQDSFKLNDLMDAKTLIENHPKINAIQSKIELLQVDRKLKANLLLPKIDVGYKYLSQPDYWNTTNDNNYKVSMNVYFPLFLRKERGSLKIAEFKIQDSEFDLKLQTLQLANKISAQQTEIKSLEKQKMLNNQLVSDYEIMLQSEERLFSFGESSIF